MKPDLLALSRAIVSLPGAPTPVLSRLDTAYQRTNGLGWRDPDGLGWVQDPDDFARYVLDLDDAATGGVMLWRHLQAVVSQITIVGETVYVRDIGMDRYSGPTLAIALARLILARGSWT